MNRYFTQYSGLKREVYILALGRLVTSLGAFVWPIMTFFLTVRLGISDSGAAAVIATATVVSLPAALLGGKLADRYSRKNIILIFDFATVSLYLLSALLPIGYHTAGLIFLASLFQTMEHPAYDALNADFSTSQQREKAFSLSYLCYNLGYIVGASVAGMLFREHLRLAFILNGLSVFTSTVLIFFLVDPKNVVVGDAGKRQAFSIYEQPTEDSLWQILKRSPVLLYFIVISCLSCFPGHVVGVLLPLQLKQILPETGAAIYGYLSSLNGFTVIVCTPLYAILFKRVTELPKLAGGMLMFGAGLVLLSSGTIWVLFVAMCIFTMGEPAVVLGEKPYATRRVPASHWGRMGGVTTVVNSLASAMAQYITSFVLLISGGNYRLVWYCFAACCAAASAAYALVYPLDRRTFPLLYKDPASRS